jgi:hypothetical protein
MTAPKTSAEELRHFRSHASLTHPTLPTRATRGHSSSPQNAHAHHPPSRTPGGVESVLRCHLYARPVRPNFRAHSLRRPRHHKPDALAAFTHILRAHLGHAQTN